MHDLTRLATDANEVIISPHLLEAESMRLAAFVRDITDLTPLTVEGLVERGAKTADGITYVLPSGVSTNTLLEIWTWFFTESTNYENETILIDWRIAPRTLGELNMLLLMMDGR